MARGRHQPRRGDRGRRDETSYTLSGGSYVAPAGVFDTLVHNGDGTWTLTQKMGTKYNFRADGTLGSIVT